MELASDIRNRCPYQIVPPSISECARFEPLVVVDRPDGAIVTCAHVRCAVARPSVDHSAAAVFYPRCALMSTDAGAGRDLALA